VLVLTPEEVLEDQKSIHDPRAKTIQFPLRNALRSKLDMSISSMMASESFDGVLIYYYKRKKSFQYPVKQFANGFGSAISPVLNRTIS
jgi:hypothetical protein